MAVVRLFLIVPHFLPPVNLGGVFFDKNTKKRDEKARTRTCKNGLEYGILLKTKSKEKITLKYIIRLSEIESGVIFRAADIKFLGNRPIINRNNMIINAVK